jgi:hypothetical protein
MPTAEADITTEHAARYLVRLCGHAGKMGTAGRRLGRRPPARTGGEAVRSGRHIREHRNTDLVLGG